MFHETSPKFFVPGKILRDGNGVGDIEHDVVPSAWHKHDLAGLLHNRNQLRQIDQLCVAWMNSMGGLPRHSADVTRGYAWWNLKSVNVL